MSSEDGPTGDHVRSLAGVPVLVWPSTGPTLSDDRAASDLIGEAIAASVRWVAVPTARLDPDFLRLSSRLAGEVLQKFVNYGLRIAIVGDISEQVAGSAALRDFIYESNKGRQVWFVPDLAALEARMAAVQP